MNFNFCPDCGTKGSVKQFDATNYECHKCGWHFWNNPKATASTLLIRKDGLVLFAKRGVNPKKGLYDIPGGFIEYYEDPYEAAAREIFEESGVRIKSPLLLDIGRNEYTSNNIPAISTCDLTFVTTEWEGEPVANDDVEAFVWKPVEFIGSNEFAWSCPPDLIRKLNDFIATMKHNEQSSD